METIGSVQSVEMAQDAALLHVIPAIRPFEVKLGDSVAINGICLTVDSFDTSSIRFTAVKETLRRSNLVEIRAGATVNMERAVRPTDRLGGHFVAGHVDGVGTIIRDRREGVAVVRSIRVPSELRKFMAEKGSVALDGVSLTIAASNGDVIDISLVPHTLKATNIMEKGPGDRVNLECDLLARYIFHLLKSGLGEEGRDVSGRDVSAVKKNLLDTLENSGF